MGKLRRRKENLARRKPKWVVRENKRKKKKKGRRILRAYKFVSRFPSDEK